MVVACDRQIAAYRGPQQRPGATAPWAAQQPRRPRALKDRTTPRETAALEDGGTEERLRSEGTPSENAWLRSETADGGRPGTETGGSG